MSEVECRVSRSGLTMCEGCKRHIKMESPGLQTTCPFCGTQAGLPDPLATLPSSRKGLKQRSRALLAAAMLGASVTMSAGSVGCSLYGMPPESPTFGKLATDRPSDTLVFGVPQVGKIMRASFVLYNGGELDLRITSIKLIKNEDNAFKLINLPATPLVLTPGKDYGKLITVEFQPVKASTTSAEIELMSEDADNVNWNGKFFVKIQHNVPSPAPRWSCQGSLQFGEVTPGTTVTKECILSNRGDATLTIESIEYTKKTDGENIDFKWDIPNTPLEVKVGASVPIKVSYTPSDTEPLEDQGILVLNTKEDVYLGLQLYGNVKPQ